MDNTHEIMTRKLKEHTALTADEIAVLRTLPASTRVAQPGEDLVRQGDKPKLSIVVMAGMVARYHTLRSGARQYLSFHIAGDWPDAQTLFIEKMDHAVSAINAATVAMMPHEALITLFARVPTIAFAIWRETLIDAAIFREAITNNSRREITVRLAHFLCEQFYRAKAAGLSQDGSCDLPLSQTQIAEALASSLSGINRAMQTLRGRQMFELRGGRLEIRNWQRLTEYGEFDPSYLHLRRLPRIT